jgi:hypothetical protein
VLQYSITFCLILKYLYKKNVICFVRWFKKMQGKIITA